MSSLSAGTLAPPFELTGMDGKPYALQSALKQGPVLATFFKVSCPTCQFTFPFIERLHQQFCDKGVQIWGVVQDASPDARHFAQQYGVTFPILIDDEPYETSREYGLTHVPTLFLVASDGHVQLSSDGFCKADLLEIQKLLAKHLSSTPGELFKPGEEIPEFKSG